MEPENEVSPSSAPSLNPDVQNAANWPQPVIANSSNKSNKKMPILIGLAVVLVIAFAGYYVYLQKQASNYQAKYKAFVASDNFKQVKYRVNSIATRNDGILQKTYTCQLTTPQIITIPPNINGSPQPLYEQLRVSLGDLNHWTDKLNSTKPKLANLPLSSLSSNYKSAKINSDKVDNLSSILHKTISLYDASIDKNTNSDETYCLSLYQSLFIMHIIYDYDPNSLTSDDIRRFSTSVADNSKSVLQNVPLDFKDTSQAANVLLQTFGSDLSVLAYDKKSSFPSNTEIALRFAKDKAALDNVVAMANEAGKNISVTPLSAVNLMSSL